MARGAVIQGYFPMGSARFANLRSLQQGANANAGAVQRHGDHSTRGAAPNAFQLPTHMANAISGGGQPLPPAVRTKMESFFGASFGEVRIHVGPQASAIGALAFTQGTDIHFAPGQYNPQTPQGQQILGHELAHVVQQRAGRVRNPFGSGVAVVQDHALEAEADRMGHSAAAHQPPAQAKLAGGRHIHSAACGSVQRCKR
jgi:hypothetical protein